MSKISPHKPKANGNVLPGVDDQCVAAGITTFQTAITNGSRRCGSSATGRVLIPFLAGLCEHPTLTRGERGVLLCIAADQRQADVILDYAEAAFRNSPILSQLIDARTARELRLTNNITVEVRAADFSSVTRFNFHWRDCRRGGVLDDRGQQQSR